jgi:hypothetical protein
MWMQVVGKVALALAPPINHGWGIALHVTARGLTTRLLQCGPRWFSMRFDFIDHELVIETTDGARRALKLEPRSVAAFYGEAMATLEAMGLGVTISPVPTEVPDPIRFPDDTVHHSYDPEFANRFWRILVQVEQVFTRCRCRFVGKVSPVSATWGSSSCRTRPCAPRRIPTPRSRHSSTARTPAPPRWRIGTARRWSANRRDHRHPEPRRRRRISSAEGSHGESAEFHLRAFPARGYVTSTADRSA